MVDELKQKADTWTPMEVEENPLSKMELPTVMGLLGTVVKGPLGLPSPVAPNGLTVPDTFDSREQWPKCVHPIRDQQQCGSCWAFGASEALSDRFCIASKEQTQVILSPEDLVACDRSDMGCNGGWLDHAWKYLEKTGAVTDTCFPYTSGDGSVPSCATKCVDGSAYKKYKCKSGSVVEATNPTQIKAEIYQNGPMETGFSVYQDFMNYKSGIYKYTSGGLLGGHAVKMVGWGSENGVDYWICANSWSTKWGEQGFFRIKTGEVGIDQAVYACAPELSAEEEFTNATQ
jgi:cathepsin B